MTIIDLETRTFIDGAAWRDRYIDQDDYQKLLAEAASLAAVDAPRQDFSYLSDPNELVARRGVIGGIGC